MLVMIKQHHLDRILAGAKRCEIRAGNRWRSVKAGDVLNFNGKARFPVKRVDEAARMADLPEDVSDCYAADHPGPFFVFHLGAQIQ